MTFEPETRESRLKAQKTRTSGWDLGQVPAAKMVKNLPHL